MLYAQYWRRWYVEHYGEVGGFLSGGLFEQIELPRFVAEDVVALEKEIDLYYLSSILSREFEDQDELQVLVFLSFTVFAVFLVAQISMFFCVRAIEALVTCLEPVPSEKNCVQPI